MTDALAPRRSNDTAVAGFVLAAIGLLPLWGAPCALICIVLSAVGLRRRDGVGRRLAVAGLTTALVLLTWQAAGLFLLTRLTID